MVVPIGTYENAKYQKYGREAHFCHHGFAKSSVKLGEMPIFALKKTYKQIGNRNISREVS